MSTILFLHAHPDDEAIFTGGTIALLAGRGHRVVVVFATSGELGLGAGDGLRDVRRAEARAACEHLGVASTVFLDHTDSGGSTEAADRPVGAFVEARPELVAGQVAAILEVEEADALVTYDADGVYGHPDHVQAHRVGRLAAAMADLPTWYEVTVDREHLHFVDTHVAAVAGRSISSTRAVGLPTVEITTTVDVSAALVPKLRAIAEHRSQVGSDPTFGSGDRFDDVYGLEWYVRHGRRGAIDDLSLDASGWAAAGGGAVSATSTPAPVALSPEERDAMALALAAGFTATVADLPPADGRRWWKILATDAFDAWVIDWPTETSVAPHDHGGSAASISVVRGALREVLLEPGGTASSALVPGGVHRVAADAVHDIVNDGPARATSVHVYSPPLSTMVFYGDDGAPVRRDDVDPEPTLWSTSLPTLP